MVSTQRVDAVLLLIARVGREVRPFSLCLNTVFRLSEWALGDFTGGYYLGSLILAPPGVKQGNASDVGWVRQTVGSVTVRH